MLLSACHNLRKLHSKIGLDGLRARAAASEEVPAVGRPIGLDVEDYKNRNVVDRAFNRLKNWHGLATRYDNHAVVHRGGMVLASIVLWLRHDFADTP